MSREGAKGLGGKRGPRGHEDLKCPRRSQGSWDWMPFFDHVCITRG